MKFAIIVQGLFDRGDSIGYDAVHQFNAITRLLENAEVRLFAERVDHSLYPGIAIQPVDDFFPYCDDRNVAVIYHYCDGWALIDSFLLSRPDGRTVIRWHNNTPPWFYVPDLRFAERSVKGYEGILRFFTRPNIEFWANSNFSRKQLIILNCQSEKYRIVFPGSRYLDRAADVDFRKRDETKQLELSLLFVSRIVAHKGHKHVIATAAHAQRLLRKKIIVEFAGREEPGAVEYNKLLRDLSSSLDVEVNFRGEVSEQLLYELYRRADVFICLSEHEGFGIPVFEAMHCGVPVVAWACSSLAELLDDHPLAFPEYDLRNFSAAIVALQNNEIRQHVLERQREISGAYSNEKIDAQLLAAIYGREGDPIQLSSRRNPGRNEVINATVSKIAMSAGLRKLDIPDLAHDSGQNFVTRYDISAFSHFLNRLAAGRLSSLQNSENGSAAIPARDFIIPSGVPVGDEFHIPLGEISNTHLIYGPYVSFPVGEFKASFLIDVRSIQPGTAQLVLDVHSAGQGVLAEAHFRINSRQRGQKCELKFTNSILNDQIEFRVQSARVSRGEIVFRGVQIERYRGISRTVGESVRHVYSIISTSFVNRS